MDTILVEVSGRIATITLNRPEKLNAFAGTMREDLADALDRAGSDPAVRCVILTGAGRAFSSGGDIEAMGELQKRDDEEGFLRLLESGRRIVLTIRRMAKPVVAMIHGVAAGAGCNLALACDYRIASVEAKLGETFARIGLHPDWGGTYFLPRLIGPSKALELMMTGRMVGAEEALALGMVDRVVAPARLHEETRAFAAQLAAGPPLAIGDLKAAVYGSESRSLEEQLDFERENQARAFRSRDAAEGIAAFFDKRRPEFIGR